MSKLLNSSCARAALTTLVLFSSILGSDANDGYSNKSLEWGEKQRAYVEPTLGIECHFGKYFLRCFEYDNGEKWECKYTPKVYDSIQLTKYKTPFGKEMFVCEACFAKMKTIHGVEGSIMYKLQKADADANDGLYWNEETQKPELHRKYKEDLKVKMEHPEEDEQKQPNVSSQNDPSQSESKPVTKVWLKQFPEARSFNVDILAGKLLRQQTRKLIVECLPVACSSSPEANLIINLQNGRCGQLYYPRQRTKKGNLVQYETGNGVRREYLKRDEYQHVYYQIWITRVTKKAQQTKCKKDNKSYVLGTDTRVVSAKRRIKTLCFKLENFFQGDDLKIAQTPNNVRFIRYLDQLWNGKRSVYQAIQPRNLCDEKTMTQLRAVRHDARKRTNPATKKPIYTLEYNGNVEHAVIIDQRSKSPATNVVVRTLKNTQNGRKGGIILDVSREKLTLKLREKVRSKPQRKRIQNVEPAVKPKMKSQTDLRKLFHYSMHNTDEQPRRRSTVDDGYDGSTAFEKRQRTLSEEAEANQIYEDGFY